MEGYKMPIFRQGNILTKDMLDCLKNYEVQFSQALFSGYQNGIIRGCNVHGEQGVIYVDKGLVLFEGTVLFVDDRVLSAPRSNAWHAIKIYTYGMNEDVEYQIRKIDVVMTDCLEREENSIEICRIRLQEGAVIRSEYRNFEDLSTEFDTVNVLYAQWAAYNQSSISPAVLRMFAQEAIESSLTDSNDISFIHSILNLDGGTLTRSQIQFYIATRLGIAYKELNESDIYMQLKQILKLMKTGKRSEKVLRNDRRMIID